MSGSWYVSSSSSSSLLISDFRGSNHSREDVRLLPSWYAEKRSNLGCGCVTLNHDKAGNLQSLTFSNHKNRLVIYLHKASTIFSIFPIQMGTEIPIDFVAIIGLCKNSRQMLVHEGFLTSYHFNLSWCSPSPWKHSRLAHMVHRSSFGYCLHTALHRGLKRLIPTSLKEPLTSSLTFRAAISLASHSLCIFAKNTKFGA